jgi:hypothetical protein
MGLEGAIMASLAGVLIQLLASAGVLAHGLIKMPQLRRQAAGIA